MGQLEGRTAIVTGAGEGIGRAVARAVVAGGGHINGAAWKPDLPD